MKQCKAKWIPAIALVLALMCACAQAAVVDNGSDPDSRLNMRSAPSRDAASLGKFSSGTQVQIVADAGDGWAQVVIGGGRSSVSGYMMKEYLKDSASIDATKRRQVVSPYGTQTVVLRSRPSNSYDAVMMLPVGHEVLQIGVSGDFCYVQTADQSVGCLLSSELK